MIQVIRYIIWLIGEGLRGIKRLCTTRLTGTAEIIAMLWMKFVFGGIALFVIAVGIAYITFLAVLFMLGAYDVLKWLWNALI